MDCSKGGRRMNHYLSINHYLSSDVKVIRTGEVGMVIDVDDLNGKVLVEFSDGNQSWEYESDILEIIPEEDNWEVI